MTKYPEERAEMLKSIRKAMGMDITSMAILMGMPYRTYQDYELGNRSIKDSVMVRAREVQDRDTETTLRAVATGVDHVVSRFPGGVIPSEKVLDIT